MPTRHDDQQLIWKEFHLRLLTNSTSHCKIIEKPATIRNRSVTEEQDVGVFCWASMKPQKREFVDSANDERVKTGIERQRKT
jgi:hypothetical protein